MTDRQQWGHSQKEWYEDQFPREKTEVKMGKTYTLEELTKMVDEHREALNRLLGVLERFAALSEVRKYSLAELKELIMAEIVRPFPPKGDATINYPYILG